MGQQSFANRLLLQLPGLILCTCVALAGNEPVLVGACALISCRCAAGNSDARHHSMSVLCCALLCCAVCLPARAHHSRDSHGHCPSAGGHQVNPGHFQLSSGTPGEVASLRQRQRGCSLISLALLWELLRAEKKGCAGLQGRQHYQQYICIHRVPLCAKPSVVCGAGPN
jgi:hypothetical protein